MRLRSGISRFARASAPLAWSLVAAGCLLPGSRSAYTAAADVQPVEEPPADAALDVTSGEVATAEAGPETAVLDVVADASSDVAADVALLDLLLADASMDAEAGRDVVDPRDATDAVAPDVVTDVLRVEAGPARCASATVADCDGAYGARDDFRSDCLDTPIWDADRSTGVAARSHRAEFAGSGSLVAARAFDSRTGPVRLSAQWGAARMGIERSIRVRAGADGAGGLACALRFGDSGWALCAEDVTNRALGACESVPPAFAESGWVEMQAIDDGTRLDCRAQVVGSAPATVGLANSTVTGTRAYFHVERASMATDPPVTLDNAHVEQGLPRARADYGFDEPSGTAVYDRGGTGDGTLMTNPGGPFARTPDNGAFGGGLTFQSAFSSEADLPATALRFGAAPFTVAFWVYNATTSVPAAELFGNRNSDSAGDFFGMRIYSNSHPNPALRNTIGAEFIRITTPLSDWSNDLPTTTRLMQDQWNHVVITRSGSDTLMYVNGESNRILHRSGATTIEFNGPVRVRIGAGPVFESWFRGRFDELRIYDAALNECQRRAVAVLP